MVLFRVAIRRDSVSLLRFPFLNHIQVFSCAISFASLLKCPYSCFSSHFCFLAGEVVQLMLVSTVLFLIAVISLPLHFFLCSLLVVVSMHRRSLEGWRLLFLLYFDTSSIIIMSCRLHGYPWPSLATSPYRSSPLVGLQGYIPYPHIAAVCMFELVVLLLLGHMWGSIGVHHLWARLCFSSSVLLVLTYTQTKQDIPKQRKENSTNK